MGGRLSTATGKAPNSRLECAPRWRWDARSQRGAHHPNPWDTQPAAGWRGEVHGRPASPRFRGSRSRGLAEPRAGRTVTLFHSATPFCRLLTRQSENTAPSLLLSEVRDVVVFFLFFFFSPPSLPFPPLSPSWVLRQLRTMLGASQQQRQMAELLDVHHTIPFLPLAF